MSAAAEPVGTQGPQSLGQQQAQRVAAAQAGMSHHMLHGGPQGPRDSERNRDSLEPEPSSSRPSGPSAGLSRGMHRCAHPCCCCPGQTCSCLAWCTLAGAADDNPAATLHWLVVHSMVRGVYCKGRPYALEHGMPRCKTLTQAPHASAIWGA